MSFAGATFSFSALAAYLVPALGARGFTPGEAVWIGALLGPMQVLARGLEGLVARRTTAVAVGFGACVLAVLGLALLNAMPSRSGFGALFAFCWGSSVGLLTIARGAVPPELFGRREPGALLGALARPSFVARALAPAMLAAIFSLGVSVQSAVRLLTLSSVVALVCFEVATRSTVRSSRRRESNV